MASYYTMSDVAMDYRERYNWTTIPVMGKTPACAWKRYQGGDQAPARSFRRDGVTGLAVIAGAASDGLVVRDYDDPALFDHWLETHPALANELPVARTKRGGHVYFRGPSGFAELDDGEYRGDGGHYTVAPPSAHPDGGSYVWLTPPGRRIPEIDPVDAGLIPAGRIQKETHIATHCMSPFQCVSCTVRALVENVVRETLPSGVGQRNRLIYKLASRLQGIPGFQPDEDTRRLIVLEWHRLALPNIGTKEFAATWAAFELAWNRLNSGEAFALETVRFSPIKGYRLPAMQLLVGLCQALQRHAGDGEFYLSCRDAGRLIGVDHRRAHRMLHRLKHDGVLTLVETGTQGTRGRATTWRFNGPPVTR